MKRIYFRVYIFRFYTVTSILGTGESSQAVPLSGSAAPGLSRAGRLRFSGLFLAPYNAARGIWLPPLPMPSLILALFALCIAAQWFARRSYLFLFHRA